MAWIHVTHSVEDYDTWKSVFDSIDDLKREHGWKQSMVFHTEGTPNDLMVVEEFGSVRKARSFLNSDELRAAMEKAGLTGPPEMQILQLHVHEQAKVTP